MPGFITHSGEEDWVRRFREQNCNNNWFLVRYTEDVMKERGWWDGTLPVPKMYTYVFMGK